MNHSWFVVGLLCVGMLIAARLRAEANKRGSAARQRTLLGKLIGDQRASAVATTMDDVQASLGAALYAAKKVGGQQFPQAATLFEKVRCRAVLEIAFTCLLCESNKRRRRSGASLPLLTHQVHLLRTYRAQIQGAASRATQSASSVVGGRRARGSEIVPQADEDEDDEEDSEEEGKHFKEGEEEEVDGEEGEEEECEEGEGEGEDEAGVASVVAPSVAKSHHSQRSQRSRTTPSAAGSVPASVRKPSSRSSNGLTSYSYDEEAAAYELEA